MIARALRSRIAILGFALLSAFSLPPSALPAADDSPLGTEVEVAIERGRNWLRGSLGRDGLGPISRGYPLGSRALVAYALLEAGSPPDDPLIERLFREMAEEELGQVYGVSLYVLALSAWGRHAPAVIDTPRGESGVAVRRLPGGGAVRDEIARCVEWLVRARSPQKGAWGYRQVGHLADPWTDFSNTQFAALALHVGVIEGVEVPTGVFEGLVSAFGESAYAGRDADTITVDRAPWLEDEKSRERDRAQGDVTLEGRPISWGYRPIDPRERRRQGIGGGTLSMTSAAVSSLLVADHGLKANKSRRRAPLRVIPPLVSGGVIELSRAWQPLRERSLGSMHRNIYYTLYSFEKAMDLAGIRVLDGTDWYRAQVPELLLGQSADGAWGMVQQSDENEYRRMATCFALLFLRRATAHLTVHEAAPIVTHGEAGTGGIATGRVLVPSLGGTVDLAELFRRLASERTRGLIEVAGEAVASVPPEERPELLPWLIPLIGGSSRDRVASFARESIANITGLGPSLDRARLEAWLARWRRIQQAVEAGDRSAIALIGGWIRESELGVPLRIDAIVALRRLGDLAGMPFLIDGLEDPEPALRAAAFRAARDLTLVDLPFSAEGEASQRATEVAAWRYWWDSRGEELRTLRRFERLRQRLVRAEDPEVRVKLREELVRCGPKILPEVEEIIESGSYAFDWLLVRQELGGKTGLPIRP